MKKIILACLIALFAALLTPGQGTGLLSPGQGTGTTTNQEYVRVLITDRLTQETEVKYVPLIDQERGNQVITTQQDVPVKITDCTGEEIKLESLSLKDQEYVRRVQQTAQNLLAPESSIFNNLDFPGKLLRKKVIVDVVVICDIIIIFPNGDIIGLNCHIIIVVIIVR